MAAMTESIAKEVMEATEAAATGDASLRSETRSHASSVAKEKESNEASRRSETSENGKKKAKEDKPPTKVVIRRLPPSMTKDVFLDQISPVPDHDYFYYVQGDPTAGAVMGFSRAYINFLNQEDLFRFTETYDNYVFVDNKGQEYPAMVEFSLFQRIPKQRSKKKDPLAGSIETNPDFIAFKESLEAAAAEAAKPDVTSKQHFFETEVTPSAPQEETTTPLLEFLKQKKADRARIRDERREEKKRKEAERKLRLKASKEKKEAEEEPREIKLLQPKEKKDGNNKETRNGRRSEKDKPPKETRTREFKSRNKSFSEDKVRLERRDEKRKEGGGSESKEDKRENPEKEVKVEGGENLEELPSSTAPEKKTGSDRKRGDRRKPDAEAPKGEVDENLKKSRNRSVRKERERKRRDDYLAKKQQEKKNIAENGERKRSRTFKTSSSEGGGSRKDKDGDNEDGRKDDRGEDDGFSRLKGEPHPKQEHSNSSRAEEETTKRRNSLESKPYQDNAFPSEGKRRNSLESGRIRGFGRKDNKERSLREVSDGKDKLDEKRGTESDGGGEKSSTNLDDKASKSDQDENKEKDPRTGRRIRNKDRPSIQIYRPGMGKFSKQRLEKERPLGSSTEVDSPSHSPSPVPKPKPPPTPP